ncbi:cytochrome P450 [Ktedonosporobacter rubrisoli]|uniref:Cytochrome P450 n=1 Tax=Ktedonosporobacter rubrisoli TaxID=2509675 RepID=A0A4P6JIW5_KTERU|nr:cytochrome P450 [Ktedonosporobacter rubrisoli]QBD74852.1 cytochrome P450 [Ktedonosporobacter rubrisoli]
MQSTEINLTSPEFKAHPYPTFAQMRTYDAVHKLVKTNGQVSWLIMRYEDAERALRDQRLVKDAMSVLTKEELEQRFPWAQSSADTRPRQLLAVDPPDHTRLRALVNISFTSRLVEQWRERIQAIANTLLDAVQDKGEMDLIEDFAFPLPITVITEMLGIPNEDHAKFRHWSNTFVEAAGDPERMRETQDSMQEFRTYLSELIGRKREQQAEDLLSKLIQAETEGDRLSENELVWMVWILLIAGHETTVNLISNGILTLLQHPDQLEKLKQDPSLVKTAIEELLRYNGPVMAATSRWAREDVEIGGKLIRRGDEVLVVLSSANRDGETFEHADELDITRKENKHLAFGKGIHYCLGAPLARMEGQIAINTLLQRMPNLRLNTAVENLVWRPGSLIMGLNKLPLAF